MNWQKTVWVVFIFVTVATYAFLSSSYVHGEVRSMNCGDIQGLGGCIVEVHNPSSNPLKIDVTVSAVSTSGHVLGKDTTTITLGPGETKQMTSVFYSGGGQPDHYEVNLLNPKMPLPFKL